MSGKATETGEAETAFVHSSPSRGYSQASTGLYVQDESVSFPSTRTGGAREDAPLLSSRSRSLRRRRRNASIGFIALLVFTCVLVGSVSFVSIILLAIYPESLQGGTLKIYSNDTILAVPDSGLDPSRINYVLYKYYSIDSEQQQDRLLLYKQQCNNLRPQLRVVDIDKSFTIPEDDFVSVMIDHQYLLNRSSITYQINMTLSSETVPSHCYAKLALRDELSQEETVEICNNTAGTIPVKATRDGYALVVLILDYGVRLKAIDIKASGTAYYYDAIQSKAELACEIDHPPAQGVQYPFETMPTRLVAPLTLSVSSL